MSRARSLTGPILVVLLAITLPLVDLLFAQPPKAPTQGKKVALLVGVNEYSNRKLENLKYAEADVKELAEVLKNAGFEVRVLLGSATGTHAATRGNIEAAFADLLKGVEKKDTVLLGFSGHGQQLFVEVDGPDGAKVKKEVPFFCPKDAVPTEAGTLVSLSGVLKTLDEKGGSHNLLLVDACRDVVDANKGKRGGIDSSRVENLGEGTAVFMACSSRQKARETDKAGGGHGLFFHFVIEGLKGGAKNDKGTVTWERLVPYVKEKVRDEFPRWFEGLPDEERQKPQAIGNLTDDPVLVTGNIAGRIANAVVVMETSMGTVKIELFEDKAPVTVKNFLSYIEDKHYDGTVFHRVIDEFVIQGGGYEPGMKEKKTRGPIKNESDNGVSNVRGTIAIARTSDPNSATAQFYINVKDNKQLDGTKEKPGYAVFGKVTEGMDVVDKIKAVKTSSKNGDKDVPDEDVLIKSVRVEVTKK